MCTSAFESKYLANKSVLALIFDFTVLKCYLTGFGYRRLVEAADFGDVEDAFEVYEEAVSAGVDENESNWWQCTMLMKLIRALQQLFQRN